MSPVHFKVGETLRIHNQTPAALIEASGLAKTTVYNIVNNKAKAVELETLSKLMAGLRELTKEDVSIADILQEETKPDWREELRKNAKPFYWDEVKKELPELTPQEKAEADEVVALLDAQRKQDNKPYLSKRIQQMLEIFAEAEQEVSH
ncbi:MAG: helix-turn-helix transcriptional regulator [Deinococcota bacterium]